MKIGFDVSQTGREKAGCGVFSGSLIRALIERDRENQYLLYPTFGDLFWDPDWNRDTFSSDRANVVRMAGSLNRRECKAFWRDRTNGYEDRMGNPDILHANNFFCPGALRHGRLIFTLYDLSFLKHPEWTTEENRVGCFDGVFQACVRADLIMAISTSTRDHFRQVFPHYPEERIRVVSGAGRPVPAAPSRRPDSLPELQQDGFWLTVATVEPRKNHLRLLKAYARLKRERGGLLPIVFAGGKGWLMERLETEISALGLDRDVFVLGYVDKAPLAWLLRNCFAFVYPSLFEGFGLPVLEAMSCGRPVLTSSVSSLPEVAGEAAILVDPYSVRSLHSGLDRLARDRELRDQLKALGPAQAANFSWETAARRVLAIYEEAMRLPKYSNEL